ncbi:hypothetical protein [Longispora fulva]|uniref:Uncharacterized protein n=1 Tax=Longispora fulva TaxID=619741 RepID=A0A8J7GEN8_9ACTN|nr:hypothetical protein [Longispora fulva]MBG6136331.1 hypothetical protein [Longispora fulva]
MDATRFGRSARLSRRQALLGVRGLRVPGWSFALSGAAATRTPRSGWSSSNPPQGFDPLDQPDILPFSRILILRE